MGHKRQALSGNTYTTKDLGWDLKVRAIVGMADRGMPDDVRKALADTAEARPALPKKALMVRPARQVLRRV